MLAASSILGDLKITTIFALFPTVLFLLLPLIDTAQVILRRLLRRKNPLSSPGKDHLHHGLLARGLSQTRTTLILWGVTLATNLIAMAVQNMSVLVIVVTLLAIVILLGLVVWRRRRALSRAGLAAASAAPVETPTGASVTQPTERSDPPET